MPADDIGLGLSRSPNHFDDGETWDSYLVDHVFNELRHGQPFLLIQRLMHSERMRHDMFSTHARRNERNVLHVSYYLGWLAKTGPLVSRSASDFELGSSRFIEYPETTHFIRLDDRPRAIRISQYAVHHTPLKSAFKPELMSEYYRLSEEARVHAFEMAVGIEAMEKLCVEEIERHKSFGDWYVRCARKLKIPIASEAIAQLLAEDKLRVLRELLYEHFAVVHRSGREHVGSHKGRVCELLRTARELGVDDDHDDVVISDLRYEPAKVIQDLSATYE